MPDSNTEKIVTDLNAGWYNKVTEAMSITDPNFQLAQGTLGLQTNDSSGLFLMADSVPLPASVGSYDPTGLSKRSSAYQLLLGALLPETGSGLPVFLGDMYSSWIAYRNSYFTANPPSVRWIGRRALTTPCRPCGTLNPNAGSIRPSWP